MTTVIVWTTTKTLCNLDTGKSILMPLHKAGRFSFVHVYCLTLLSLHTITVLPLTGVYIVSEVHCTSNVLHSIIP